MRRLVPFTVSLLILAVSAGAALATPGDVLIVRTAHVGGKTEAEDVAVGTDGTIVVGGWRRTGEPDDDEDIRIAAFESDLVLARYDRLGEAIFEVTTDLGPWDIGTAVAIQRDGRIVLAGHTNSGGTSDFVLARYEADGDLDPTFGDDGVVIADLGGTDRANAVSVLRNGRITVAGESDGQIALVRYLSDGSPDPDFGSGGVTLTDPGYSVSVDEVTVAPNGEVVVVGSANLDDGQFMVAKYDRLGHLRTRFAGGSGVGAIDLGGSDHAAAVVVHGSGKLTVVGFSDYDVAVVRLLPTGRLDTNFGVGGKTITDLGGYDEGLDAVIRKDGSVLVIGTTSDTESMAFLVRYRRDGLLDPRFGDGGIITGAAVTGVIRSVALGKSFLVGAGYRGDDLLWATYEWYTH